LRNTKRPEHNAKKRVSDLISGYKIGLQPIPTKEAASQTRNSGDIKEIIRTILENQTVVMEQPRSALNRHKFIQIITLLFTFISSGRFNRFSYFRDKCEKPLPLFAPMALFQISKYASIHSTLAIKRLFRRLKIADCQPCCNHSSSVPLLRWILRIA
jgi:hypothetical protein